MNLRISQLFELPCRRHFRRGVSQVLGDFFIDDGIDLEAVNRDFVEYGGELEKRL